MQRYITLLLVLGLSLLLSACAPLMRHVRMMKEHGVMDRWQDHWEMHHGDMDHDMGDKAGPEAMPGHQGMDHGAIPAPAAAFDAQFIDSMIAHHEGAIAMAKAVQAESERPELLAMAEAIIADQGKEIEQMQAWRAAWYPDLPPSAGMDMPMGQMSIDPTEEIPFDQRFLTAMIDHHQGAIHMAEMALAQADHEELTALSKRIIAAQTAEIEQMQEWLQTWFDVTP